MSENELYSCYSIMLFYNRKYKNPSQIHTNICAVHGADS